MTDWYRPDQDHGINFWSKRNKVVCFRKFSRVLNSELPLTRGNTVSQIDIERLDIQDVYFSGLCSLLTVQLFRAFCTLSALQASLLMANCMYGHVRPYQENFCFSTTASSLIIITESPLLSRERAFILGASCCCCYCYRRGEVTALVVTMNALMRSSG